MSNDSPFVDEYSQLIGFKVTQIAIDDTDDEEAWTALVLEKGNKKKLAWILRDPEGNGAGFLDIRTAFDSGERIK